MAPAGGASARGCSPNWARKEARRRITRALRVEATRTAKDFLGEGHLRASPGPSEPLGAEAPGAGLAMH